MKKPLIVSALLLILDQVSKLLIRLNFEHYDTTALIPGVLHISYIRNTGVAFGWFKDQRWVFSVIVALLLAVGVVLLVRRMLKTRLLVWAAFLILAGGFGNLIDRVAFGFVTDFIDLRFLNFYVFNLADCFVVAGAALVIIHFVKDIKKEYSGKKAAKELPEEPDGNV